MNLIMKGAVHGETGAEKEERIAVPEERSRVCCKGPDAGAKHAQGDFALVDYKSVQSVTEIHKSYKYTK